MVKTIFKAKYVYPVSREPIADGFMLVDDGKIIKVGHVDDLYSLDADDAEIVEFKEGCILPGLINSHAHLEYTSLGKLYSKSMIDFLWQTIEKTAAWKEAKIRESVKQGIKFSLEYGVTTIADVSRWGISPMVLSEYPIIADVALEAFSYDSRSSELVFEKLKEKLNYLGSKVSSRVRLSISPHSPYNADARLWELAIAYAKENNILIHSHVAESLEEKKWFEFGNSDIDELHSMIGWNKITPQITSISPVEYLSMLGLLSPNLVAAHLCYASTRDLELLEDQGVSIVICPRSNVNLHKKCVDYDVLNSLKIRASIGTDGVSSAGSLNILEDIRLYNSRGDIPYQELTKMVTLNAAKALNLSKLVGSLEAGKLANFVVFDPIDDPANWFNHSKPSHVFVEGSNVRQKVKL